MRSAPPEEGTNPGPGAGGLGPRAGGRGLAAGCLPGFLPWAALFAGIPLDRLADPQPMFTLTFVLGSIPISLIAMVWWVLRRARRIALDQPDDGRAKEH